MIADDKVAFPTVTLLYPDCQKRNLVSLLFTIFAFTLCQWTFSVFIKFKKREVTSPYDSEVVWALLLRKHFFWLYDPFIFSFGPKGKGLELHSTIHNIVKKKPKHHFCLLMFFYLLSIFVLVRSIVTEMRYQTTMMMRADVTMVTESGTH